MHMSYKTNLLEKVANQFSKKKSNDNDYEKDNDNNSISENKLFFS